MLSVWGEQSEFVEGWELRRLFAWSRVGSPLAAVKTGIEHKVSLKVVLKEGLLIRGL
jgi:hypothetical protein